VTSKDVVLKVENLRTGFQSEDGGILVAVDDLSFDIKKGETLGLVGESGCGKSVTSLSIMRLLPQPAGKILGGRILLQKKESKEAFPNQLNPKDGLNGPSLSETFLQGSFDGIDIVKLPPAELHQIRGRRIAMIFQEPMTALNPVHSIERQLAEPYQIHFPEMSASDIRKKSIEMLDRVGIPSASKRLNEYPHQLSGGMRQRVMIAIALSCGPDLLIADEPTTALDVTIQAQILELMQSLQKENGMAILFITHDLGVVAQMCDRTVVMYAGRAAETGISEEVFRDPRHPYTRGLLGSIPKIDSPRKTFLPVIEGMVPSLADMPQGCRFQNRCPLKSEQCISSAPRFEYEGSRGQACWNWRSHD